MPRWLSVALTTALVLSIGAQCLSGHETTAEQMACCVGTNHDCGAAVDAPDCCQTESTVTEQLAAQLQKVVFPPVLDRSVLLHLTAPATPRPVAALDIDRPPLIAASPPKYVLLATFLI